MGAGWLCCDMPDVQYLGIFTHWYFGSIHVFLSGLWVLLDTFGEVCKLSLCSGLHRGDNL